MFKKLLASVAVLFVATSANAELEIDITGGINEGHKIAIYPFEQAAGLNVDIASIVSADLTRSGKFNAISTSSLPANGVQNGQLNVDAVAQTGAEFAVFGKAVAAGDGYNIDYQLVSLQGASKGQVLGHWGGGKAGLSVLRQASHRVSDRVYEKVVGQPGCFRTRIAYVVTNMRAKFRYTLMTADYDGYNEVPVVKSTQPIMTPSWSPDGTRLVYVSFEKRTPAIFVQDIKSKKRTKLTEFPGLNSSPNWSPDGSKIAMTLSRNGNPDIFYFDLSTKQLKQVTSNPAIDTEPSWSSDSRSLYFSSDRGGKAQIYKYDFNSGKTDRVTYNQAGRNLSAHAIPGTTSLVVITQVNGFRVARVDADGSIYMLTTSTLDESPSVAPNGSMVIYSTIYGGKKGLALVSTDGRFKANLPSKAGEISSVAWGPFVQKY